MAYIHIRIDRKLWTREFHGRQALEFSSKYRVAKMHRMPYPRGHFPLKSPIIRGA